MATKEEIDWQKLSFDYMKTDFNIRCYYKNGVWGALEVSEEECLPIPIGSACLQYGQQAFEGVKAFEGVDGKIRVFRPMDHAKRLQDSCKGVCMPEVPTELFMQAIDLIVKQNRRFVPPYGTGASLYIRPMVLGLSPNVKVLPATEFMFAVFASPVGAYFKSGIKPCKMALIRAFDRTALNGTGAYKVGGNYASGFRADVLAEAKGYTSVIYLDAKEKQYIDECGAANFFAIRGNSYITPENNAILPSITNRSLMQIASDMGLEVERRAVHIDELNTFDEVGACGTGAVITPIAQIDDLDEGTTYYYGDGRQAGAISQRLYDSFRAIQLGKAEDRHKWNYLCPLD